MVQAAYFETVTQDSSLLKKLKIMSIYNSPLKMVEAVQYLHGK